MPSTNRKKKAPTKTEHALTVLFIAGRLLWVVTKFALVAALAVTMMFLAVVGMMVRGVSS